MHGKRSADLPVALLSAPETALAPPKKGFRSLAHCMLYAEPEGLLCNIVYLPRVLSDNLSLFIIDKGLPVLASTLMREVQSCEGQLYWKSKMGS